jgi:hypothetical protein
VGDEGRLDAALSAPSAISAKRPKSTRRRDPNIETYYSSPEIRSRMARLQEEWRVGKSGLHRWLLGQALALVEKGKLKPPLETVTRARL